MPLKPLIEPDARFSRACTPCWASQAAARVSDANTSSPHKSHNHRFISSYLVGLALRSQRVQNADSSSQQKIRRHKQFETQFRGDLHVRHALTIAVFLAVVEVFDHLFEDDAADVFKAADAGLGFGEVTCRHNRSELAFGMR